MLFTLMKISRTQSLGLFPTLARNAKIMEEVGEFSEALLHKLGYLPHKEMKEPLVGEAADVIITVIDTLCAAYPEMNEEQLIMTLNEHLRLKSEKWKKVTKVRDQDDSLLFQPVL
jgi:NTP pyrophosphatase (non-canonical NTP hydrolase)